jgi:hypothetical protein
MFSSSYKKHPETDMSPVSRLCFEPRLPALQAGSPLMSYHDSYHAVGASVVSFLIFVIKNCNFFVPS